MQRPSEIDPLALASITLLLVGLSLLVLRRQAIDDREQLEHERTRRRELEAAGRQREERLDGALDTIHKLRERLGPDDETEASDGGE